MPKSIQKYIENSCLPNPLRLTKDIERFLLRSRRIRYLYGKIRFQWYNLVRGNEGIQSRNSIENTSIHNLKALKNLKTDFNMPRMNWLIHAVLALEKVNKRSQILSIGARTENEILLLRSFGFNSITAVDLQTYSPLIQVGDMHKLNFRARMFDVVFCGWAISYSRTPKIAASEILRVTKSGGIIAIGIEHVPNLSKARKEAIKRKDPLWEALQNRVNSCKDILVLFGRKNIRHVYFKQDFPLGSLKSEDIYRISGLHSSQVLCVFEKK